MGETSIIEKILSVLLGTVAGLFLAVWWVIKNIGRLLYRMVIDVLKNIYLRVITFIATLILLGLGLTSLAQLH